MYWTKVLFTALRNIDIIAPKAEKRKEHKYFTGLQTAK
jgi:hypothetical protein